MNLPRDTRDTWTLHAQLTHYILCSVRHKLMRRQLSCLITVVLITTMAPTVSWPPRSHGPHGLMAPTVSWLPRSHGPHGLMAPTVSWLPRSHGSHGLMAPTVSWPPRSHGLHGLHDEACSCLRTCYC